MLQMNKQNKKVIGLVIILGLVIIGGVFANKSISHRTNQIDKSNASDGSDNLFEDEMFSFSYPSDFTNTDLIESLPNGKERRNIIFKGSGEKDNFQLVISDFDDKPITIERIKKEIPNIDMQNAQEIAVDNAKGVVFTTTDKDSKLTTREIWFSRDLKLYQISTYPEFDTKMEEILVSWRWNQ